MDPMIALKDVLKVIQEAEDLGAECKAASGCQPLAEECFDAVRDGLAKFIAARQSPAARHQPTPRRQRRAPSPE